MPLFEYVCNICEAKSEILVRGDTPPVCPECGSSDLVKQASAITPLNGGASSPAPSGCGACSRADSCPMA